MDEVHLWEINKMFKYCNPAKHTIKISRSTMKWNALFQVQMDEVHLWEFNKMFKYSNSGKQTLKNQTYSEIKCISSKSDCTDGGICEEWYLFSTCKMRLSVWHFSRLTLMLPEPYICIFNRISHQINSTQVVKMFCGRCLVIVIITFWRCIFSNK